MDVIKMILDVLRAFQGKKVEKPEQIQVVTEVKVPESKARKINSDGLKILKSFEGLELRAYKCPAGIWTIGYGSTGPHVKEGMVITEPEAEELLRKDLERFEAGVADLVSVPLSDNQFSALVVFSFNVGLGNLQSSTLLRKLNFADYLGAANEFTRWTKAGGKVLSGLVARRQKEKELFFS